MAATKRQNQRLIVLLVFGVLVLNFPLLSLFSKPVFLLAIPLLYLYLFLVWALFIGLLALILRKRPNKPLPKPPKSNVTG